MTRDPAEGRLYSKQFLFQRNLLRLAVSVDNYMKVFGKDVAKIWEAWGGDRKAFFMKKGGKGQHHCPIWISLPSSLLAWDLALSNGTSIQQSKFWNWTDPEVHFTYKFNLFLEIIPNWFVEARPNWAIARLFSWAIVNEIAHSPGQEIR